MKGIITSNGDLRIARGNDTVYNVAGCPYEKDHVCGQWCALFGDPEDTIILTTDEPIKITKLTLCKKTLTFTEFKDEQ